MTTASFFAASGLGRPPASHTFSGLINCLKEENQYSETSNEPLFHLAVSLVELGPPLLVFDHTSRHFTMYLSEFIAGCYTVLLFIILILL